MQAEWYNGARLLEQTEQNAAIAAAIEAQLDVVEATAGAEAANAIEVACSVKTLAGVAISSARGVRITARAATDNEGDLAAAGTPVGSLVGGAENPATGSNVMHMLTTAAGLFSFKVTDTAAESVVVTILVDGCAPRVLTLTFT